MYGKNPGRLFRSASASLEKAHTLHREAIAGQSRLHYLRIGPGHIVGYRGRVISVIGGGLQHTVYFPEDRTYPQCGAFSVAAGNNEFHDTQLLRQVIV